MNKSPWFHAVNSPHWPFNTTNGRISGRYHLTMAHDKHQYYYVTENDTISGNVILSLQM